MIARRTTASRCTDVDYATYYCVHLRRGVWRHAKSRHHHCTVCAMPIPVDALYLDTGITKPGAMFWYQTFAVCIDCAARPVPDPPSGIADFDPHGVTPYGEKQLQELKHLVASPRGKHSKRRESE